MNNYCDKSNRANLIIKDGKIIILNSCCYKERMYERKTIDFEELNNDLLLKYYKGRNNLNFYDEDWYPHKFEACFDAEICNPTMKRNRFGVINVGINGCNLNCIMCDLGKNKTQTLKDIDLYYNTLEKIKNEVHPETILLTCSGEPFFLDKERTLKFIESFDPEDDMKVSIITNATLLFKKDIDRLIAKKDCIRELIISCDAITKKTYKKIRRNDFFDKVQENIKYFNDNGMKVQVNFVIQKENYNETFKVIDFYKDYENVNVNFLPENKWSDTSKVNVKTKDGYLKIKDIENIINDFPEFNPEGIILEEFSASNIVDLDNQKMRKFIKDHPDNFHIVLR